MTMMNILETVQSEQFSPSTTTLDDNKTDATTTRAERREKEVMVFGDPEEMISNTLTVRSDSYNYNCASLEKPRQIQPSSHMAPSHLPNGDTIVHHHEDYVDDHGADNNDDDEEEDVVPALPSVKVLTDKFHSITIENKKKPVVKSVRSLDNLSLNNKIKFLQQNNNVAKVSMMMMKKKQSNKDCYKQVFFILNIFENLIQTFTFTFNNQCQ